MVRCVYSLWKRRIFLLRTVMFDILRMSELELLLPSGTRASRTTRTRTNINIPPTREGNNDVFAKLKLFVKFLENGWNLEFIVLFWLFTVIMFVIFISLPVQHLISFWICFLIVMWLLAKGYLDFAVAHLIQFAFHEEKENYS
ncbi:hypothetical protein ACFFRR_002144 [Megaselia abdita]